MNKTNKLIPFDLYKETWLNALSTANYFNQCTCSWCNLLKYRTTLFMNYMRVAWDLKSFIDKVEVTDLQEFTQLYALHFHSLLTCVIINNVIDSIVATDHYYNGINYTLIIKHE